MSLDFINEVDTLLADSRNYIVKIETESENQEKIRKQLEEIDKELKEKSKTLEFLSSVCSGIRDSRWYKKDF